jgi:hypothetical protein
VPRLALLLAVALAAGGCGDSDDPAEEGDAGEAAAASPAPDADAAEQTLTRFIEAARNGQSEVVCALVSADSSLLAEGEAACAEQLDRVADAFAAQIEDEVHGEYEYEAVRVRGDTARISFVDSRTDPVTLRIEDGEWRVVLP